MKALKLKNVVIVITIFLSFAAVCIINCSNITARPGNGHHSFGSHSSSSSHSSGWSSSSSGSHHSGSLGLFHSSGSHGSTGSSGSVDIIQVLFIIAIVLIILWYFSSSKKGKSPRDARDYEYSNNNNYNSTNNFSGYGQSRKSEAEIQNELNKIMQKDSEFFKEDFISKVNEMFMFIYSAWEKRDLNLLRAYETDSLFNLHKGMINEYIQYKQINMLDNICIRNIRIIDVNSVPSYDSITVRVTATLNDYTIDEETQNVVDGSKTQISEFTEIWTFIRKGNVQTKSTHKVNQCPNCGAPLNINSDGECSYCRTVVTKGDYGWVLSNIEQVD